MDKRFLLGALLVGAGFGAALATQEAQEAAFTPTPEMMRAMTPGPMHARLEPLIGNWEMTGKWRMSPEAPWAEFGGEIERKWILDGRFVHETVDSEWMGKPFQGVAFFGHDNLREELNMVWIDNMSTATHTYAGHMDDDGNMVFVGENSDPMTGQEKKWSKTRIDTTNADEHVIEMWTKDESGEAFVAMTMALERI